MSYLARALAIGASEASNSSATPPQQKEGYERNERTKEVPPVQPPAAVRALRDSPEDVEAATAWFEARSDVIQRTRGVSKPEADHAAWLEMKTWLDDETGEGPYLPPWSIEGDGV